MIRSHLLRSWAGSMCTQSKRCFKCLQVLPLEAFYKHSMMSGGRMNKCKECTKRDVKEHRQANLERVRAYDKLRGSMPHRVAARKEYAQTEAGKLAHKRALDKQKAIRPKQAAARYAVSNALRDGKLVKLPCVVCGSEKVEGHHADYDRPLDVVWLCNRHHREAHALVANDERKEAA